VCHSGLMGFYHLGEEADREMKQNEIINDINFNVLYSVDMFDIFINPELLILISNRN